MKPGTRRATYWRRNLVLTLLLLAVWFVFTFLTSWYARELNGYELIGPLGFYLGAQGSLLVYVLIVWIYARRMERLDAQFESQCGEGD
jgi:putative solute:sodium symporter small subunit